MRKQRPNYRLAKIHRSYTVEEIARLFGIHRNTVRSWIKTGLVTIDDRHPILIQGREMVGFLQKRRALRKRICGPGELYCLRCRAPQLPDGNMVEYKPITATFGNLTAICPTCSCLMHRIIGVRKLEQFYEEMAIVSRQALPHIGEIVQPRLNSDLR